MAKNKVSEWSSTPANNTDVGGIDIAEGCAPSGINNAIREMMAQIKDMEAGTDGDSFAVGGNLSVTGTSTFTGAITASGGVAGTLTGNVTGNVTGNLTGASTGAHNGTVGATTPTTVIGTTITANTGFVGNLTGNVTGNASGLSSTLAVASGGTGVTSSTGTGSVVLSNSPTLTTPALGTPSAVVLTNATGTANSLNAGIGVNQTWQDVTSSRAYGTTYTNSTGKPIAVASSGTSAGSGSFVHIGYINGTEIIYTTTYAANAGYRSSIFFIVPNGATYSIVGTGGNSTTNLYLWSELR